MAKKGYQIDLSGKKFVAFGINSLEEADFEVKGCGAGLRPEGGLCAYLHVQDGESHMYAADYEQWCNNEGIRKGSLRDMVVFSIQKDVPIYTVKTWADLNEAIRQFPLPKGMQTEDGIILADIGIDYAALSKKYKAFYFSNDAVALTDERKLRAVDARVYGVLKRMKENWIQDRIIHVSASGFEAASIFVFDKDIIKDAHYMKNPNIYKLDANETFDEALKEIQRGHHAGDVEYILGQYYRGRKKIGDIAIEAEKMQEDGKKFESLVKYILDLEQVHASGDIDLEAYIGAAMEKAYQLAYPSGNKSPEGIAFEQFSGMMKEILDTKAVSGSHTRDSADTIFANI